jgi:anti-anti-sigma factor
MLAGRGTHPGGHTVERSGQVTVDQARGTVIIGFTPDFELANLDVVNEILDEAIGHGHMSVVVDMRNITLTSSSALFPFLERWPELRSHGGDLKLCGLPTVVREALRLMAIEELPEMFDSVEEAIQAQPATAAWDASA